MSELRMKGGDDAVLLIHGLTGTPFELKYLAKKLNKAGFTIEAPLLAGHGTSLKDLKTKHWQDWYETVRQAYLGLKKTHGSVCVSGLCMGALLALYLASEEDVDGVSLLSSTLFYDGWSLPWYRFLLPLAYYPPVKYFYSYKESPPYGIKNERLREIYLQGMKEGSIAYDTIPPESMHELFKLSKVIQKEALKNVKAPTLILHSAQDDLASSKNADVIERGIGSSVVRKVILDDSYHMITIDNQKDLVAGETAGFFSECVGKRDSFCKNGAQ